MKNYILLIILLLSFAMPCLAKIPENELKQVSTLFATFLKEPVIEGRTEGNSIASAGDFYARLLDARINCEKARIVILLRKPKGICARYLEASPQLLRRPMKSPLVWHAILTYEGQVFDTASKTYGQNVAEYFKSVWKPIINCPDFKILPIQLKDLPQVAQSISNSTGSVGYELFSWQNLEQNPLLTSQIINE